MSRLSKLYQAMETLKREGLHLSDQQEAQLRKAEEEIIQKEILPVMSEKVEPVLSQIERELVLVVDYSPNSPIKVSLSRRRNIRDVLKDVVEIKPDPEIKHKSYSEHKSLTTTKKSPRSTLRITMPDGHIIESRKAKDSFIEAILRIGIDRVRPLGYTFDGVPLISSIRDSKYGNAQTDIGNGWLIITHSSTLNKKKMLEKIAKALRINIKVEIL